MKSLFWAALLILACQLNAQEISPASTFDFVDLMEKKPDLSYADYWPVEGYEFSFFNQHYGLAEDNDGNQVFLQRYPETEIVRGIILLEKESSELVANGQAVFLSPNGYSYQAGDYSQNKPHGSWIEIEIDAVFKSCSAYNLKTLPNEVESVLKTCYPDIKSQQRITVKKANYENGLLNGPATFTTLAGDIKQKVTYQLGKPIGKEFQYNDKGNVIFKAKHKSNGSDTTLNKISPSIGGNGFYQVVTQMPAYPSAICIEPDMDTASEEQKISYSKCTTNAMLNFIYSNITYPTSSREENIEGTSVVNFVVEKDGSLTNIRTVQHVSGPLDSKARSVVSKMPSWLPGIQDGEPVRVMFNLPVMYRLE